MKTSSLKETILALCAAFVPALANVGNAQVTNFDVTTPGGALQFFIDGSNNTGTLPGFDVNNSPMLTLRAGNTYTFNISVAILHPTAIVTAPFPAATSPHTNSSPTTGITSGTITLTIPSTDFPSSLYYQCDLHRFYGVISILPPLAGQPPPPNTIISIVVAPNGVTVTSNGTNTTYSLVPQFNSNVIDGNWQDVPGFSNTFANGTNTTTFGRLEPLCGSNVFLRISQRPPQ